MSPRRSNRNVKDKGTRAFEYLVKLRKFLNRFDWGATVTRKHGETSGTKPPPPGP